MIDLIEKIHDLKDYENYDYDQAITDVEILLDQYNIITAPKTIKLSEIVSKLNEIFNDTEFSSEINFNRKINAIGYGEYDDNWRQNTWFPLVKFNKDLTINRINIPIQKNIKWLYTLWIAGTVIEDDLQDE